MGIRDQFAYKAQQLKERAEQAEQAGSGARDEAPERASKARKPGREQNKSDDEAMLEAQDRFNLDYDA
ncbi:hypothetical protein OG741_17145 [Streptomyces sp. NBC_01410]|uniref:hypothetical protein n=1 Tax=Streptomyces sp. NBC_01410 TaxID=2903856 RepID=UPI00325468B9